VNGPDMPGRGSAREEGDAMSDNNRSVAATGGIVGPLWFGGWLFTIAFAKLIWWQAIIALFIWPYYLGVAVR
jgi:hypothetical protein